MLPTPTTRSADYKRVYEPAEDSFLLLDVLTNEKKFLNDRFTCPLTVEIGTGSGVVTSFLQQSILSQALYLTTDINVHACTTSMETSKENGGTKFMDTIRVNLVDCMHTKPDIIVFNPPYVPDSVPVPEYPVNDDDNNWLDFALVGGEDGMQVTNILLESLGDILSPTGVAYILFCKSNKPYQVADDMKQKGWKATLCDEQRAGREILSVWRFER